MAKRIELTIIPVKTGSGYPSPFVLPCADCAGFKAGIKDGHHLQNRSDRDAILLEVGSRRVAEDEGEYPDIDMRFLKNDAGYAHRDGALYPTRTSS
jgi:uncharacterized cupin superfamily protein